MIVRASFIKIVSTAMGIATKDPDYKIGTAASRTNFMSSGSTGPAARYLYFHYYVQTLRMCWQDSIRRRQSQAAAIF
ncbi:hypothetical protein HAV15_002552 [Penicillium sp. str. |nr:hypothetical protein HAV15_002552 [Penicillium sp. str. \